jgi:hypothetical protein
VKRPSTAQLDALVEEALVDAYDEYEQQAAFDTIISDRLALPFETVVLGQTVTVRAIDLRPGTQIAAICTRGRHRQAIGILDLPLPDPAPPGAEWIEAYRHWAP